MKKLLLAIGLSLLLTGNGYCAWAPSRPTDNEKLKDTPALIRANWDAIALGTDANLLVTNAKVSPTAAIVDTKLAQITTASKVSTSAITGTLGIGNGGTGLTSAGGTANRILGTTNGSTFGLLQVDIASAMITGSLPIANGGTGLANAGGVANRVMLTTDGSAFSVAQVGLTTMVTGTLPVGNGGTGATAAANAASGVVVLNASSQLPAVSGALLTNLPVSDTNTSNLIFHFGSGTVTGSNYVTVHQGKFKKIAGISSITFYAELKNDTSTYIAYCQVQIGSLTAVEVTNNTNSYVLVDSSAIDVSSLTNNTVYDIVVQLKCNDAGHSSILRNIMGIAS